MNDFVKVFLVLVAVAAVSVILLTGCHDLTRGGAFGDPLDVALTEEGSG